MTLVALEFVKASEGDFCQSLDQTGRFIHSDCVRQIHWPKTHSFLWLLCWLNRDDMSIVYDLCY